MSIAFAKNRHFRKNALVLAVSAAVAPHSGWAIDMATAPPGTKQPYVAPNVILSLDDSGSMDTKDMANKTKTRTEVLKEALSAVFNDTTLLPDGKIRFAWQSMNRHGGASSEALLGTAAAAASVSPITSSNINFMRPLQGTHRANFLNYVTAYTSPGGTPTHPMMQRADEYMRGAMNTNGPWATTPGEGTGEYLACRRNYHILFTDGGWNQSYVATAPTNYDGTSWTLDGGIAYDPSSVNTRVYKDMDPMTTIADWAFKSWATPLQSSDNVLFKGTKVQPSNKYTSAPANETFTNRITKATATLPKYWNPRYDPATWPHMQTYTIGFTANAIPLYNFTSDSVADAKVGNITAPSATLPYGYDGSFADYANGTYVWRASGNTMSDSRTTKVDRGHDMWHAALNGRGGFYAVTQANDLKKAFEDIIDKINTANEAQTTSTAASGTSAARLDVGTFTARYEPQKAWKGSVSSATVNKDGTATAAWSGKTTADLLDVMTPTSRVILSWSDQWTTGTNVNSVASLSFNKGGVPFKWASDESNLSALQKAKIGLDTTTPMATSGQDILDYIRGVRSNEATSGPFRARQSAQGDIVNSGIWYTGAPAQGYALQGYDGFVRAQKGRTPMIYVGGNDGMLHGFSATDGTEKIAYVPNGVLPKLKDLADPNYSHKYYVDGSPMTGDVELGGVVAPAGGTSYYQTDWRTLLVGTLGAGGKGYFVLDVTNPVAASSSIAPAFGDTAALAQKLVRLDRTRGEADALDCTSVTDTAQNTACLKMAVEDADIGHITAMPVLNENDPLQTTQITRTNNGRWAAILGNGYNSVNQRPVLLVQYLDGAQELLRIPATADVAGSGNAKDNGLSAPRLVDLNGDGRVDIAYAGDNLGNLWKFDLTSETVTVNTDGVATAGWGVAFGGQPLFTALTPTALNGVRPTAASATNRQPITVPPTVRANDRQTAGAVTGTKKSVGGMMVAFGTGRNIATGDPTDTKVQTLYAVLDNTRYTIDHTNGTKQWLKVAATTTCPTPPGDCLEVPAPATVSMANLVKRQINAASAGASLEAGRIDEDSSNPLYDANGLWIAGKQGWYMDLPEVGERLLKSLDLYDSSNVLLAYTQVPAKGSVDPTTTTNVESCNPITVDSERQYRTMLNIMDGKRPTMQLIDVVGTGTYSNADNDNASRRRVTEGGHVVIASTGTKSKDIGNCPAGAVCPDNGSILRAPEQSLRPSWRKLK